MQRVFVRSHGCDEKSATACEERTSKIEDTTASGSCESVGERRGACEHWNGPACPLAETYEGRQKDRA